MYTRVPVNKGVTKIRFIRQRAMAVATRRDAEVWGPSSKVQGSLGGSCPPAGNPGDSASRRNSGGPGGNAPQVALSTFDGIIYATLATSEHSQSKIYPFPKVSQVRLV